jgi:hypothetical protein
MKPKPILLTDTERLFLSMVLNDVVFSPFTIVGQGYKPYAYYMINRIEGKYIPKDMRKAYEKFIRAKVKKDVDKIFGKVKK